MAYSFLEPIRVGKMVLKNRIIVPAMARYLCEDGFATEDYIRYYEAMAKGGVAMVTVGIMPIDLGWPSTMTSQPCLGDDKYIPQLQKAVTAMHAAGAKVSFQPWMPGRAPYTYADAVERAQDIAIVNKLTKDEILNILTVREALDLCNEIGAISAYAYLGDVGSSVTGDKRAQKFEDDYLDDVIAFIKDCGIRAVTYMPTRNTPEQLTRLRRLCDENGLFQVSGEDINSPRQSFVIRAMDNPAFSNLIESTWKLIDHETKGAKL